MLRNLKHIAILAFFLLSSSSLRAQYTAIPDTAFENALIIWGFDKGPVDGKVLTDTLKEITTLAIAHSNIKNLKGVEDCINLKVLLASQCAIETLDLSNNLMLERLECNGTPLTSLRLPQSPNLKHVECSPNASLQKLTVQNATGLETLSCSVLDLELKNCPQLKRLDCRCDSTEKLDLNHCMDLEHLALSPAVMDTLDLSNNKKIRTIWAQSNGGSLKLIQLADSTPDLVEISCRSNKLVSLNLLGALNIESIDCSDNAGLQSLQIQSTETLKKVLCNRNGLSYFDLSAFPNLERFEANNNQIHTLKLNNSKLLYLAVHGNQLKNLELDSCISLISLIVGQNQLEVLDINRCTELQNVYSANNDLRAVYMKNGKINYPLEWIFKGNANLQYVCADLNETQDVLTVIDNLGMDIAPMEICRFKEDWPKRVVQLSNRLLITATDCSAETVRIPYLKYMINEGLPSERIHFSNERGVSFLFTDTSQIYARPLMDPKFYHIEESNMKIQRNKTTYVYKQRVCLNKSNDYSFLEPAMFTKGRTRPGFLTLYDITVNNNGNVFNNGYLELKYDHQRIKFENSNVALTSPEMGTLMWRIGEISPFEKKTYALLFKTNRPTDSIPVNGGDFLDFNIRIDVDSSYEKDTIKEYEFKDPVVNSYDPNDITCLQGKSHAPEVAGKPLDYMIRFENTGSASAIHIRIENRIDTSKFDVQSIEILETSHACLARLTKGNLMEFMFENIYLPHTQEQNKGYVVYRIHTLPKVKLGDTLANQASIFFDYNFPIITNNEKTPIVMETSSLVSPKGLSFKVYPNPTNGLLSVESDWHIKSVEVLDIRGQSVLKFTKNLNTLNLETLSKGLYFIEVDFANQKLTKRIVID